MAQLLEQQITRNPFIPKPVPLFRSKSKIARSVRRSTSSPQLLPSQISQSTAIRAVATTQILSVTPPAHAPDEDEDDDNHAVNHDETSQNDASHHSSPFSISGTLVISEFIIESDQEQN